MQMLHEYKTQPVTIKNLTMNSSVVKEASTNHLEVKERRSSDTTLQLMNVASGDNVTNLNSTQKLKVETPPLVACCEGRELQISEDLVRSGLSAISVKHDSALHSLSMSHACERMQVPPGFVKHRNSFRSLHRPELKRVPYLRRMTPDELETLFSGYADLSHGNAKNDRKEDTTKLTMPPDENTQMRNLKFKEIEDVLDVPEGMQLHGARARLYTSVLVGAKAGDQLECSAVSINEKYDTRVPEEILPEDEVQLTEELQIILPPRCDDVTTDSSVTTTF